MRRLLSWGALLAIALPLTGCYTEYGPVVTDSIPIAPTHVASRLESGDQLKIIVFGEDQLSGLYDISPAGTISMPLIGPITAAGRTDHEMAAALVGAYSRGKFLQEPKITVSVVSYRPVYVLGEVTTPGKYAYTTDLDVLGAVATAGGFTYRASRTTVLIRHPGDEVWQKYSLAAPQLVQPGDIIRIPERYF